MATVALNTRYRTPGLGEVFVELASYIHRSGDTVDRYRSLRTCGDGACGIHAIVGDSTAEGFIKAAAPRTWVSELVHRCTDPTSTLQYLATQVGAARAKHAVENILLAGHCESLLRDASGSNPTDEARVLEDCLLSERQTDLLEECRRMQQEQSSNHEVRENLKAKLLPLLRCLFREDLKDSLLRSVAIKRQCLPGEFDAPPFYESADGRLLVLVSKVPVPANCPQTKFDALFDPAPCFDMLRQAFVEWVTPGNQEETFLRVLSAECQVFCDNSRNQHLIGELTEVLAPICDTLQNLEDVRSDIGLPRNYGARVWRSYLIAWQSSQYWFSCDELLVISMLAGISVRIFEAHGQDLILWNEYDVRGVPPVCVKVANTREHGPVRGHFERLVLVEDLRLARLHAMQQRKDAASASTATL